MKKISLLLGLLFAVVITACSVDNDEIIQDSQENSSISLDADSVKTNQPAGRGPSVPTGPIYQDFERSLDWAAYIAGITFYHEVYNINTIRTSFVNSIAEGKDVYTLEELIGPNPIVPEFKDSFMHVLGHFCDEQVSSMPLLKTFGDDDPGQPVYDEGDNNVPSQTVKAKYLNYILNENCVELYFPNGLDFSAQDPNLATVAHPLNNNNTNLGYQRQFSYATQDYTIGGNYVNIHGNTIVGRPQRISGSESLYCLYAQYSTVPDFEVFLNGYGAY